MQVKIFNIPVAHAEESSEILNKFLRGNKIISIDKQFYSNGDPCWTLMITYLPGHNVTDAESYKTKKIDYRDVLSEREFNVFTRLRTIRKQLASDDGVPAYAVFTDAELAKIASLETLSSKTITSIQGIGDARVNKYGLRMIQLFNAQGISSDRENM